MEKMTMERRSTILAVLLIFASLLQTALAAEYVVGDTTGWTYATDANFYTNWAAQQDLKVGDTLKFNWQSVHNVVQLSPADTEACNLSGNEINTWTEPGVSVLLRENGTFGYICSISTHCPAGNMKMIVNVSQAATGTPAPPAANTPPPPAGTTTPPPPSAASSLMQFCQPLIVAALATFAASAALYV